jgi:hypothetical protein
MGAAMRADSGQVDSERTPRPPRLRGATEVFGLIYWKRLATVFMGRKRRPAIEGNGINPKCW